MNKQNNKQIIEKMQSILDILSRMLGDTRRLQSAMQTQEDMIRGDNIMNDTMDRLTEINAIVEKMKRNAERVADSVKEGAEEVRRVQINRSNNIRRI